MDFMSGKSLSSFEATKAGGSNTPWIRIADYDAARGWFIPSQASPRALWCCEQLEEGRILYFDGIPYDFPEADRQFLLQQRQSGSRIHKNISYRPKQDVLRGSANDRPEDVERLHRIMRHFSEEMTGLLTRVLAPYAPHWALDFASFRPEEENGRRPSTHKRNDLASRGRIPDAPDARRPDFALLHEHQPHPVAQLADHGPVSGAGAEIRPRGRAGGNRAEAAIPRVRG